MKQRDSARELFERLESVEWEGHDLHTFSRLLLLDEYLRRAALWASTLGCPEKWPFFDIAACVDPSVRADPRLVQETEARLDEAGASWYAQEIAPWMLHWAELKSRGDIALPDLDDPFEPLLIMFERGGGFYSEHGFLTVDTG